MLGVNSPREATINTMNTIFTEKAEDFGDIIKKILSSRTESIKFMHEAGIYDEEGHLTKMYQ